MSIASIISEPSARLFASAPKDTLTDTSKHMVENNVNAVVVLNDQTEMVGILTAPDIMKAVHASNGALGETLVSEWMTGEVITCAPETKLTIALKLMRINKIRHIVVTDEQTPLALLGIHQILEKINEYDELKINVPRDITNTV